MSYEAKFYNFRWWILRNGRLLGGYSANALRPYVFPLYTPKGVLVLQEAPPDHPHHQGVVVGLNVNGHDLWNAGSFETPRHQIVTTVKLAELTPVVSDIGVTIASDIRWNSVDGEELLHESRQVSFSDIGDFTLLKWQSEFYHPQKSVELAQTKESGIGLRVPPHWETPFGGRITNDNGDVAEKGCFDKNSAWLAISSGENYQPAGVVLKPQLGGNCPWFTRDYGLHVYNPLRLSAIKLNAGERMTWAVDIFAFDGTLNPSNVLEASSINGQ